MNESGGGGEQSPFDEVFERLREVVTPIDRTETLPVSTAVGRPLADPVVARRPVPHYEQVARDGFAVAAAGIADATDEAPVSLTLGERAANGQAVRVDAGSELPPGADAVVSFDAVTDPASVSDGADESPEATPDRSEVAPRELAVTESIESGTGAHSVGADVADGETVRAVGHRLSESDPALCTAVGQTRVEVLQRPTIGIVPTGGGVAGGEPGPETVVETNGTTISEFVERWGGKVTYRNPVSTDRHALRPAVERDLTKDLIVTVGGTGEGERDRIGGVIADLGDMLVDGIALDPGATASLSVVRERPVLSIPGDPVAAVVTTALLVGPAVTRLAGRKPPVPDTFDAELSEGIASESGVVSVVPVAESQSPEEPGIDRLPNAGVGGTLSDETPSVRPVAEDPFSTLARADGWVVVPAECEHLSAGEIVTVQRWERPS